MDSSSEDEPIDGPVDPDNANWGKSKYDYYYTDYIDKDYPSKLTAKEERLAALEQEEALRIQKKLLSTIDNVNLRSVYETEEDGITLEHIEEQNRALDSLVQSKPIKRKKVAFANQNDSDSEQGESDQDEDHGDDVSNSSLKLEDQELGRKRRPINAAIQKNRGLTPYKKKEYRNPRVKHKLKYKKAISKRRRNVREHQTEFHRYSGESSGIKTSTIRSIRLS